MRSRCNSTYGGLTENQCRSNQSLNTMPLFSLIVATVDRTSELERLLASLAGQSSSDFEVIIVDQNPDDRLRPVIDRHRALKVIYLRSGRGLSRARNIGLAHANGDIFAFPDDDCWYPPELLEQIQREFGVHPECGSVFATLRDADHQPVGPKKWPDHCQLWTKQDLWKYGISPAGFLRAEVVHKIGLFNEKIGIGAATPYQSGEDVDYFVRPLSLGWQIWYNPGLTVHHPSFHRLDRLRERSYSYALGGGYILRAHGYPIGTVIHMLLRSVAGIIVFLFRGNLDMVKSYLWRAAGLVRGYFFGPRDLQQIGSAAE